MAGGALLLRTVSGLRDRTNDVDLWCPRGDRNPGPFPTASGTAGAGYSSARRRDLTKLDHRERYAPHGGSGRAAGRAVAPQTVRIVRPIWSLRGITLARAGEADLRHEL